ncbi:MAG: HlyD family secretion protein [Paracoccus sp. (in: a-proteobacteria)]
MVAGDSWIEANFKETQLEAIAPGQPATVEFDSFPGRKFDAVVEITSPGTGSEFPLLPAQNASGNWVTVKLRLDPDQDISALRAGLSAEVTVDTQRKTALEKIEDRVGMNIGTAAVPAQ